MKVDKEAACQRLPEKYSPLWLEMPLIIRPFNHVRALLVLAPIELQLRHCWSVHTVRTLGDITMCHVVSADYRYAVWVSWTLLRQMCERRD